MIVACTEELAGFFYLTISSLLWGNENSHVIRFQYFNFLESSCFLIVDYDVTFLDFQITETSLPRD